MENLDTAQSAVNVLALIVFLRFMAMLPLGPCPEFMAFTDICIPLVVLLAVITWGITILKVMRR